MIKVRIYIRSRKSSTLAKLRERFNIKKITVNYEAIAEVDEEQLELLRICKDKKIIEIR